MHPPAADSSEARALWSLAEELADVARAAILPHFRHPHLVAETKLSDGFDPVTTADRAAEDAMRSLLAEKRPQDAILGEERGAQAGSSGLTWILDPIDGTRSFLSGMPTWGVLIGLVDAAGPVLGVIDQPYIGERFRGGLGRAGMSGPRGEVALATRPARPLGQAILFTTFPEIGTAQEEAAFGRVAGKAMLVRYGADCYAYGLVAAGHVDLVIEAGLQPYDVAALIPVIEAAGGLVTDWQGAPILQGGRMAWSGQVIAAANPAVHAEALALLGA